MTSQGAPLSRFFASEVAGLAPWVRDHLSLLDAVVGLELEPLRAEAPVGPFRLDLLASARDANGLEVPVAVELQLGSADHDHLGKLVTYLAHQGRGVGVWVVDRATHPHLTAIDFLNRATGDGLSWWMVTFTQKGGVEPDPARVQVEALAGPGIPLPPRPVRPVATGTVRSHPTRTQLLEDVLAATAQPSMDVGWRNPRITNKGYAITWALPAGAALKRTTVKLRAHSHELVVHLLVQGYGADGNERVIEALRSQHGSEIEQRLPSDGELRWHQAHKDADSLQIALPGVSWDGDPDQAPDAVLVCLDSLLEPVLDRRLDDAGRGQLPEP